MRVQGYGYRGWYLDYENMENGIQGEQDMGIRGVIGYKIQGRSERVDIRLRRMVTWGIVVGCGDMGIQNLGVREFGVKGYRDIRF